MSHSHTGANMKKYKVVQWATGGMGKNCLRAVIDHPAMELVGVYVYGADKAGKDAGAIARRELTGVLATRNVDEILALDADVVIHAARLAPPYGRTMRTSCACWRRARTSSASTATAGRSIGVASEWRRWRLHAGKAGHRC